MEALHDLLPMSICFINKLTPVPNAAQIVDSGSTIIRGSGGGWGWCGG